MSPQEKAQEIVSEWLRADFRGEVSIAGRGMLEALIAAALRAERTRALEDAANACDRFAKALPHSLEVIVHDLAIEIRALKDRP